MERDTLLALAFEQSIDGLLLLEDGVVIDCNTHSATLLGYPGSAALLGLRPSDFSPIYQPDGCLSVERERAVMAQARAEGSACFEWVHRRVDGSLLPVEVLLTAVAHGGRHFIHANWRDISCRHATEKALAYRRSLEALITQASGYFINLPTDEINAGINRALGDLGAFVEADRSYVFLYNGAHMHNLYEWCAPGIAPQIDRMRGVPIDMMAWFNRQILRGDILNTTSLADLPAEAQAEKEEFAIQGIQSVLVVPMERRGQVIGFVGFDAVRRPRHWPDEMVDLLRIAAGIIANVLDRRDAELLLRETNATLESRVQQRTHELEQQRQIAESLRDTLAVVNSSLSLQDTLDHLVRQARTLTDAAACSVYSVDLATHTGRLEATVGIVEGVSPDEVLIDLDSSPGRELLLILSQPGPIAINFDKSRIGDIRDDPTLTDRMRAERLKAVERFSASLAVTLASHDEAFGALILYYYARQDFTEHQLTTAQTLAEQAALAIENARLHQAEQERRAEAEQRHRIAEGLREGLAVLNSNRSLDAILDFIVRQAVSLLGTGGGALYLVDEAESLLWVGASLGLDPAYTALPLPVGGVITGRAVALGEPVSVPDLALAARLLDDYMSEPGVPAGWGAALQQLRERYNAVLSVPVKTGDRAYGAITLYYPQRQQFSDEVIALAVAFAGQAALVIENAHLRQRVRETAAIEERSRLARDLHDAVTQTLFSASLIADTLPHLWAIDRADAERRLAQLAQLTRGALAEMRTLLIELRPARLVEADIASLLQQLVDAGQGRSQVTVALKTQGPCDLPPDVKIVCYRVTQEALNNIIKHAEATHAFINLRCTEAEVMLHILDDGRGFDPADIPPGHFGVQIMAERAASIGAALAVDSEPGEGTAIQLLWRRDHE